MNNPYATNVRKWINLPLQNFFELSLTAALRYRGHYTMELLIGHQVAKGASTKDMELATYQPEGRRELRVNDKVVVTQFLPIHYMVERGR